MNSIVPPPAPAQARATQHPDVPEMGDDEDVVDYICRVGDWLIETPPVEPLGFRLVPCEATPRHHPLYEVAEDVFYERPCPDCVAHDAYRTQRRLRCQLDHRQWKSWRIVGWLARKGYSLGVLTGCGTSYGRCEFCGIGRQHTRARWRGKRSYFFGVRRDVWSCLRRGHRFQEHIACGLCSVCAPCPECGSTDPTHYSCEVA